jgi:hypothetical protein
MPIVFVIARDWKLRVGVRAELREAGMDALGMESAADAGKALASGQLPAAIVVEAVPGLADDPQMAQLIERVPAVLVASRAETVSLPPVAAVLYRPVRVGDVVALVHNLVKKGHAA